MKEIKLSHRLSAIASLIKGGKAIVDVGTDHGYLPVWLAQQSALSQITATDIKEGPLAHARSSALHYGVQSRIDFVLTDGLRGLSGMYDTVVIAGMGGETIVHILENAPWALSEAVLLVLQPQTKQEELLLWLKNNGAVVCDAVLAQDERRIYMSFSVAKKPGFSFRQPLELLFDKRDPLLLAYLSGLIEKNSRALCGLKQAQDSDPEEITTLGLRLEALITIKGEADTWLQ